MTNEGRYMLALVNILYYQALRMGKEELQPVLFYEEHATDFWTLNQCRIQYVKDQLEFISDGNLDDEIKETWNTVFKKENV
tara:strand:- start:226 stop:468 length:243 start_codon:yes stop_codon:yes gene_type:complete